MKRFSSRRSAFTLVELLVVIGIIAVLIGILLPVLSRARKQANITKCSSALRQIAYAFTMYSKENRDKYPPLKWENFNLPSSLPSEERSLYWQDFLLPYTMGGKAPTMADQLGSTSDAAAAQRRDRMTKSVFWGCPEWVGSHGGSAKWQNIEGVSVYDTGYCENWMPQLGPKSVPADCSTGNSNWDAEGTKGKGYTYQKWAPYAQRCLVTESLFWRMHVIPTTSADKTIKNPAMDRTLSSVTPGWNNVDLFRHGKYPSIVGGGYNLADKRGQIKWNILYADGHVDLAQDSKELMRSFILRDP